MKKASTPQEWYDIFVSAIEKGDLEQAASLYDDNAVFQVRPGQMATDAKAIREGLTGFISMKTRLNFENIGTMIADNICLVRAKWNMALTGPDGKPKQMQGESSDVLRRQPDGSWRILLDNPYGSI